MRTDTNPTDRPTGGAIARLRGAPVTLVVRIAAAAAMIAALVLQARPRIEAPRPPPVETPFVAAMPAAPGSAPLPAAQLGVTSADASDNLTARIDPQTGLREDILTRGAFEAVERPALRVTLTRGASAGAATSLFVLTARRAAQGPAYGQPALAVVRAGMPGVLATKFGAVETLEVTLGGAVRRSCTGFVSRDATVRIDGWFCGPLGQPAEARSLGCLIDALSLVDLSDPDGMAAFAAAAVPERICDRPVAAAPVPVRTASIGRRAQMRK